MRYDVQRCELIVSIELMLYVCYIIYMSQHKMNILTSLTEKYNFEEIVAENSERI